MKQLKLLFAGIATIMSGGVAQPADVAQPRVAKAPSATPMPAFSWTGCHVGIHGGWGRVNSTVNARSAGMDVTNDSQSDGALVGGQFGCDYQAISGWVVGLQGDIAASNVDRQTSNPLYGSPGTGDMQWLASLTGRFGYVGFLPQTLVYLKVGGAWTRQNYRVTGFIGAPELNADYDKTFGGWTAGGGIAWALSDKWSVFAEYNHYDFSGSLSRSGTFGQSFRFNGPTIDAVKVGLDYRF